MTDEEEGSYKPGPVVIEAKDFRVLERVRWTPDGSAYSSDLTGPERPCFFKR